MNFTLGAKIKYIHLYIFLDSSVQRVNQQDNFCFYCEIQSRYT